MRSFVLPLLILVASALAASAQSPGYAQYCCTRAGRFGPFSNGSVNVGGRCSAVDTTGVRRVGVACNGPLDPLTVGSMDTTGYANSCCTDVGVLGPFDDVTWQEGQRCVAKTADGKRHEGTACYGVGALLERVRRDGTVLAAARHPGCPASGTSLAVANPSSPGGERRTDSR